MILRETPIFFGLIITAITLIVLFIMRKPWKLNLQIGVFMLYITAVIAITLFPIELDTSDLAGMGYDYEYNFVPFSGIISSLSDGGKYAVMSVVGNIIMFMPLGFLVPLLFDKSRQMKFWQFMIIFLLSTVFIEFMQFLIGLMIQFKYRCVDIDDVILNFAGALIGLGIYKIMPKKIIGLISD